MAIVFEKKTYPGKQPAFYREECKILPGDFALKQTFPDGTLIERGTPIQLDYSTDDLKAAVVKIAKVVAGGTTSKPRVVKGSYFIGGETVMKLGKTDASPTVTSIDKSNASYDEITLSGAIVGLAEGDFLQESSAFTAAAGEAPAIDAAPLYIADAVVAEHKEIQSKSGFPTIAAGCETLVLRPNVYPIPDSWLQAFSLKNNQSIKYIKQ